MNALELEKEIKIRRDKLSNSRMYELGDPGRSLEHQNDREEIVILQLENQLLKERLSRYEKVD